MKYLIALLILLVLLGLSKAQDDNSTIGGMSPLPFVTDPIPDGDYSDHHILPMTLDPRVMLRATRDILGEQKAIDVKNSIIIGDDGLNLTMINGSLFYG